MISHISQSLSFKTDFILDFILLCVFLDFILKIKIRFCEQQC